MRKKKHIFIKSSLFLGVFVFLLMFTEALAAPEYKPLVGLPGVTDGGARSLGEYINALYTLTISIGVLIAVFRISMAGVKYAMDDVITNKEEAKNDIQGVLIGLGILLIPFIVLTTINPNLVNLNVLKLAPSENGGNNSSVPGTSMTSDSCPSRYKELIDEVGCEGVDRETTSCVPTRTYRWSEEDCQIWCSQKPSYTYIPGLGDTPPSCHYSLSVNIPGA